MLSVKFVPLTLQNNLKIEIWLKVKTSVGKPTEVFVFEDMGTCLFLHVQLTNKNICGIIWNKGSDSGE